MKFEKITKVRLPFDMRHEDPKKNYGIHATDIWFVLKGEKGSVQYAVTLPCYLPHIPMRDDYMKEIRGFDVGYHSLKPMFEGQTAMDCDYHGKCYYDGSSLRSERWTTLIFNTVGRPPEDVLWELLEEEYIDRFGEDYPSNKGSEMFPPPFRLGKISNLDIIKFFIISHIFVALVFLVWLVFK